MKRATRRKFRILATLTAMALSLCLMVFGIFAATNVKYTATNTLTFNAQDVSATVTGTWKKSGSTDNQIVFGGGTNNDGVFTPDYNHGAAYTGEVSLENFNFDKVTDSFIIKIKVANTFSEDVDISATLTTSVTNDTNGYIKVEYAQTDAGGAAITTKTAEKGGYVEFEVTVSIDDAKQSASALLANGFNNIGFAFELTIVRA